MFRMRGCILSHVVRLVFDPHCQSRAVCASRSASSTMSPSSWWRRTNSCGAMIRRYRWRKVLEQAKVQAEFERRIRGAPVDLLETRPKVPKGGGPRQARYDNSAKLPREAGKTYVKVQRRHRSTKKQDAELAECVSAASASSPTEHPGRVRGTSPATLPTSANGSLHLGA